MIALSVIGTGTAVYAFVIFDTPKFGIEDPADVNDVNEKETDLTTTLIVNNRANHPLPTDLFGGEYNIKIGDTVIIRGNLELPRLSTGNNTLAVNSTLDNRKIPQAWTTYLRDDETTEIELQAKFDQVGPINRDGIFSQSITRTVGEGERPLQEALSGSAQGLEGNYTETVPTSGLSGVIMDDSELGYEVRNARVEISDVNENITVMHMKLDIYNPSEAVPIPAEPDNLGVTMRANDINIIDARNQDSSLVNSDEFSNSESVDGGPVILPQQEKTATYRMQLDNQKIDEWFVSHLQNEEYTRLNSDFQLVFTYSGFEYRIPGDSPVEYNCEIQTNFFYENEDKNVGCDENVETPTENQSESSKGSNESDSSEEKSEESRDSTNMEPVAISNVTPTSGDVPLEVSLDGTGSYDSDGKIDTYEWSVDGVDISKEGVNQDVSIPIPGEYQVILKVTDDDGSTNTTRTTVTVSQTGNVPTEGLGY